MSPVIRISDETWERLKSFARPLEDSADDVVRRALDALVARTDRNSSTNNKSKISNEEPEKLKRKKTIKLPQREFREPLLQTLSELGGKATAKQIRQIMEEKMSSLLHPADYQPVSSGEVRWWNAVCWERKDLVEEGILSANSERGIWELSANYLNSTSNNGSCNDDNKRKQSKIRWKDDVCEALKYLDRGDGASLSAIYRAVKEIRRNAGRSVPISIEETIRQTLECNSKDSENFNGEDIFCMPSGKGVGIWGLRDLQ